MPLAERWGIGDDFERARLVTGAPAFELRALVDAVDAIDDGELYGWLAGPESLAAQPTPEYIAATNLTMAADQARLLLRDDAS